MCDDSDDVGGEVDNNCVDDDDDEDRLSTAAADDDDEACGDFRVLFLYIQLDEDGTWDDDAYDDDKSDQDKCDNDKSDDDNDAMTGVNLNRARCYPRQKSAHSDRRLVLCRHVH